MGACTSALSETKELSPHSEWSETSALKGLRARDPFTGALSRDAARALEAALPDSACGRRWCRVFNLRANGSSLGTLLRRCRGLAPTLLVIKSVHGEVFGCFAGDAWFELGLPLGIHASPDKRGFFGFGKSAFVFNCGVSLQTYPIVSGLPPQYLRVRASRMGGVAALELGVGGGGEAFAILLDEGLESCSSGLCAAFASPPLAGAGVEPFKVLDVDLWAWAETDMELLVGQPHATSVRRGEPLPQMSGGAGFSVANEDAVTAARDAMGCAREAQRKGECEQEREQ
jgi:hypothetical protein